MDTLYGLNGALAAVNASTIVLPVLVELGQEIDPDSCQLLGPFALVIQALMGLIVIGSLVLKRAQEKNKRSWRVWTGDVSKQILGQALVHASNVFISDSIARHQSDNPCSLYALNIFFDCTAGVLILYGFLKVVTSALLQHQPTEFRTGDYGSPPQIRIWAKQAAVYVFCLLLMKLVVLIMFWIIPGLFEFANWCLSWVDGDEAQVIVVMLLLPVIMNVLQFLIIDSILKSKHLHALEGGDDYDEEARRGFLEEGLANDVSDDDEDQHDAPVTTTRRKVVTRTVPSFEPVRTVIPAAREDGTHVPQDASDASDLPHSYPPDTLANDEATKSDKASPRSSFGSDWDESVDPKSGGLKVA